ncbi:MAG: hypothetical protein ABEH47_06165 [Haloferacaceae archaeon]
METELRKSRSIVSLLSRSDSALEAATLAALLIAVCGCLGRAALHFV